MTQDDVIRLAVKCQLMTAANREGMYANALFEFAKLVATHEREVCAKVCEQMDHDGVMIAKDCATAIRARGNT
jgi:gamma-glutamylcysteine synthetase